MFSSLVHRYRRARLARINRRSLRKVLDNGKVRGRIPIFFIFTPDLVHFAPFCIEEDLDDFEAVIVLNAVSHEDELWLGERLPERPVVNLTASLRGNKQSMLAHGDVLNDLCAVCPGRFCVQDPDCFVTDRAFYAGIEFDPQRHFAAGPFSKSATDHEHHVPDTFFLMLQGAAVQRTEERYGISADVTRKLSVAAVSKLREIGYVRGDFPEQFKGYFDTLQAYWLVSMANGLKFNKIPGDGTQMCHIGGTSYLKNSELDLAHWDYWPLSVRYFNMRLLENPALAPFRERFAYLKQMHGSADQMLIDYPEFLRSERYRSISTILKVIEEKGRAS